MSAIELATHAEEGAHAAPAPAHTLTADASSSPEAGAAAVTKPSGSASVEPSNGHAASSAEGAVSKLAANRPHALAGHPSSMDANAHALNIAFDSLSWTVTIDNPSKDKAEKKAHAKIEKAVLKEVSGVFRAGKFTAVMGSSGAGKTTLLNVVAGFAEGGKTTGRLLLNGQPVTGERMRELSAFVHQHDEILQTMTVREAVTMAAFLRLPRTLSAEEKHARVEEVLRWLSLVKVADNQIGSPEKKGISGGERRRVSVAMEMVRNVSCLFLDEPTSGLDTFTAYSVAHLLRSVAHQHSRTIVATIHQPSSEIYHLFDDLVLLDQGRVIYAGPAADAMQYFHEHLGFQIPKFTNPSDFIFMHILNAGGKDQRVGMHKGTATNAEKESEEADRAKAEHPGPKEKLETQDGGALAKVMGSDHIALTEETKVSEAAHRNGNGTDIHEPLSSPARAKTLRAAHSSVASAREREERLASVWNDPSKLDGNYTPQRSRLNHLLEKYSTPHGAPLPDSAEIKNSSANFITQFKYLCARAGRDVLRNPYKLNARVGQAIFVAIFCGLVYLQVGYGQDSVQNRNGVLFFLSAGGMMNACMGTVAIFAGEKAVFRREYGARMYGLPAFFSSKLMMELPLRVIFPIVQAAVVYWMVGLANTARQFWILAITLVLLDFTGTTIGMLLATVFGSLQVALAASPMVVLPLMLFSGFFLNAESIPPYFDWISYVSPIKYAFISLAKNEYPGLVFTCDKRLPNGECTPWNTGENVLEALNFDTQPEIGVQMTALLVIGLGCIMLSYFALWRTSRSL